MKLYYDPISTTSRIVTMFAAEEGIDLDLQMVRLMAGEQLEENFRTLNPNCLVPVLDDDGFRLTESGAIVRYLADKAGAAAYPRDLRARARVDEAMEWFYSNFAKDFGYGLVYPQLFPNHRRPDDAVHAGTILWGKQRAEGWLGILDTHMIGPEKRYLCGDAITLADYVGAELVTLGELIHCTFEAYPNVRRWLADMKALQHWPRIHDAFAGFVASLEDQQFESI